LYVLLITEYPHALGYLSFDDPTRARLPFRYNMAYETSKVASRIGNSGNSGKKS
jgi:hypothetical protein